MGEGGCPPDYFLYRMSPGEARDYVTGMNRRHRQGWEQTRALMGLVCKVLTGETMEMRLPWDDEEREPPTAVEAEEIDRLRSMARDVEKRLNSKKGE